MLLLFTVILLLLVITLTYKFLESNKKSDRMPKGIQGPPGFPILGNILQMVKNPHLKLSKWAKKYGALYTIRLGFRNALVTSDAKSMKDLFGHPASTKKFQMDTFLLLSKGRYGIFTAEGEAWAEQRQFFIRSLVDFGFGSGKTSLEPLILDEAQYVIEWIEAESKNSSSVCLNEILRIATSNVLWTLVNGKRNNLTDNNISLLTQNVIDGVQQSIKNGFGFFPWIKYIAPELSGYNSYYKACNDLYAFITERFEEHKSQFTPDAPKDIIDAYIQELLNKANDPSSSFYGIEGERHSIASVLELFIASSETTPGVMLWLVLYVCHNQSVQRKLHDEIETVIGTCREPSLLDKPRMPFTDAVIQETFRISPLAAMGIVHELSESIEFQGHTLPKGLLLLPNIYHVHHDEKTWGDPENFRPERFLNPEETEVNKSLTENLVPFQAGKRQCVGETLARDVIFLFIVKLFQTYDVLPDPDNPEPNYEPDVGLGLICKPFKVRMQRKSNN
ncbi:unnamed protein product [Orchesella dallaii]|uniref:Farnesoate epoxidase n=1 Tax=Orchesella dallaii TaxID=48710 RepID=A0ABP1RDA9_9HEXA